MFQMQNCRVYIVTTMYSQNQESIIQVEFLLLVKNTFSRKTLTVSSYFMSFNEEKLVGTIHAKITFPKFKYLFIKNLCDTKISMYQKI